MWRTSIGVRILCVVGLMVCAGRGGRAGGVPPLLISEFRTSGPGGPADEYIEITNPDFFAHTVSAASGIGYGIAASDGITRCTILNGTVIPPGGHFLCVNSSGYSLSGAPAGSGATATGDASYTLDIPDNAGIALFNNNIGGVSYTIDNRADAAGPASEANPLYKEGTGYAAMPSASTREHAWVRATAGSCASGPCTPQSLVVAYPRIADTNDNASSFYYTDTTGGVGAGGAIQRLGAPGPQNLGAPISPNSAGTLSPSRLSACSSSDMPPNRLRDTTAGPPETSPLGTLEFRVKWTNTGTSPITRLRFRVVDLTTLPAPAGTADLRVLSAPPVSAAIDNYPCGVPDGGVLLARTTLEQPAAQPGGGGLNSALSVVDVSPGSPLLVGGVRDVRFRLGVAQDGFARFCIMPEATPAIGVVPWCYVGSTRTLTDVAARGDYDGDRASELTMYNPAYNSATVRWTIRESSGGFVSQKSVALYRPDESAVPVQGDFDGDGRVDPALYIRSTGTWVVIYSHLNYEAAYTLVEGGAAWEAVPGDYDGDGTTDLAVASVTLHRWKFRPSSSTTGVLVERVFGTYGDTPIGGQDFDGDGLSDMVLYNAKTGIWTSLQSSSNFTMATSQWWGGVGLTPVAGDYDGDLQSDYGFYQRSTGVWWILLSGRTLVGPYHPPYSSGFNATWGGPGSVPVPADYDGDGKTDVGVYQAGGTRWRALTSSTGYSTSAPLNVIFGTTGDRAITTAVLPAVSREIRAGDADGDGLSDLTAYDTTTGIWSTLRSSDGFMMPPMTVGRGGTGYTAVPGDYDGDGRRDAGAYQASTGHWDVLRSDSNFTTNYPFDAGGVGWVPVAGDYDGDGRADMIVYNTATGQWYGGMSAGNFTSGAPLSAVPWGGPGYEAAPGDYDGDGRLDMAVYQNATGYWWILTSSSGYTTGPPPRFYGAPGWVPVPADYDGDGITDVAVHNPVTGVWAFLRSDTGNTLGYSQGNGGTGYTPVAGDWDGDRRADIASYRVADGFWSIVLSGTGYTGSLPRTLGGPGQVPVPASR